MNMGLYKIGEKVTYSIGRGKKKKTIRGIIFEVNPKIAPNTKYGILSGGERFYPIIKVKRVKWFLWQLKKK